MDDFAMEWNDVCRVCLQNGDLISFYTKDDCDISICDKIMYCAAVNVSGGYVVEALLSKPIFDDCDN